MNLSIPSAGLIPNSLTSIGEATSCEILPGNSDAKLVPLRRYLRGEDLVVDVEADEQKRLPSAFPLTAEKMQKPFFLNRSGTWYAGDLVFHFARRERLFRQLEESGSPVGWWPSPPEVRGNLSGSGNLPPTSILKFPPSVSCKLLSPVVFVFPAARLAVLSDAELFGRSSSLRQQRISHRRERMLAARAAIDFTEFEPGDYVVHLEHGIRSL